MASGRQRVRLPPRLETRLEQDRLVQVLRVVEQDQAAFRGCKMQMHIKDIEDRQEDRELGAESLLWKISFEMDRLMGISWGACMS